MSMSDNHSLEMFGAVLERLLATERSLTAERAKALALQEALDHSAINMSQMIRDTADLKRDLGLAAAELVSCQARCRAQDSADRSVEELYYATRAFVTEMYQKAMGAKARSAMTRAETAANKVYNQRNFIPF